MTHVAIFIRDLLDDEDTEDITVRSVLTEILTEVDVRLSEMFEVAAWNQVNDIAAALGEQFPAGERQQIDGGGEDIQGGGEGLTEE
jgi:hypothetical protein